MDGGNIKMTTLFKNYSHFDKLNVFGINESHKKPQQKAGVILQKNNGLAQLSVEILFQRRQELLCGEVMLFGQVFFVD